MFIRSICDYFARRAIASRISVDLIAEHGCDASIEARGLATRALIARGEADLEWDVVTRVDRDLRLGWQPDTATRYLAKRPDGIRRSRSMRNWRRV